MMVLLAMAMVMVMVTVMVLCVCVCLFFRSQNEILLLELLSGWLLRLFSKRTMMKKYVITITITITITIAIALPPG